VTLRERLVEGRREAGRESERDFREEPPKVRKLPRLRRFKALEGGDAYECDDRCTGVGDSPTPPVLSMLANAVGAEVINVERLPRNGWETAARPWELIAAGPGAAAAFGAVYIR
jgi:hypothetical protein